MENAFQHFYNLNYFFKRPFVKKLFSKCVTYCRNVDIKHETHNFKVSGDFVETYNAVIFLFWLEGKAGGIIQLQVEK